MRCNLAWIDTAGQYVTSTEEYAALCGHSVESITGLRLEDAHPSAVINILQPAFIHAREQGQTDTVLALFDQHTLYDCRLIWVKASQHFVLYVERAIKQSLLYDPLLSAADNSPVPLFKVALNGQIASARKAGKQVALLKLGLERFQWIQDSLGLDSSETIIEELASRLLSTLREGDILFRANDDAFIIQISNMESAEAAVSVAHRLIEQLSYSFRMEQRDIHLSASIGVALAPLQANDAAELLGAASQALKALSRSGISDVRLYDPLRQRKALNLNDLAQLIKPDYNSIELGYRPVYGVRSHRIEAAQLVPLLQGVPCIGAEEHLLTQMLEGESGWHTYLSWIFNQLETPLQQLGQEKGFQGVIVRIPPDVLELPSFMEFMTTRLTLSEIVRNKVLLEVDAIETQDHEGVLFDLEALGFGIVLGGLSDYLPPIQQLKELEPQLLKLDASLVQAMENDVKRRRQLEQLVDMAADLDIALAADGVLSAGQRMHLSQQGVDYMQGDYFGRLLSAELLFEQLILEKI
ncbi:diguanylate cyclase domain-containing protein [Neptunomonas antarctica]|uniref:Diguanylate cyclase (GGDEF) domain-containing protein n=1 Tax=Neptunomonas antarctica TaxID=619304 RepID=A0A1N7IZL8_9GAMM|nr:EAL domain-containing protein [Neptunomonas antarctica]SIS42446.1 diguanylate cyclase (GGDEF) domain-containing protein [Neptunomonas antarctica]